MMQKLNFDGVDFLVLMLRSFMLFIYKNLIFSFLNEFLLNICSFLDLDIINHVPSFRKFRSVATIKKFLFKSKKC